MYIYIYTYICICIYIYTVTTFKYTNLYFIQPPGPRDLARLPHFKCRYRIYTQYVNREDAEVMVVRPCWAALSDDAHVGPWCNGHSRFTGWWPRTRVSWTETAPVKLQRCHLIQRSLFKHKTLKEIFLRVQGCLEQRTLLKYRAVLKQGSLLK